MAEFQELGLNPTARPTDQFMAPEVRRKLPGSQLLQLAGALKDFSKDANDVYQNQIGPYEQNQQLAADRDFAQANASGNLDKFKAAVKSGQMHEADNPWYHVQLQQDMAREEAKNSYEAASTALGNSPIQHSDDPKAVASFIDQQFASVLKGKNAWQVQAMLPELNHYKQSLIAQHIDQRRQEVTEQRTDAFAANMRSIIDPYTADVAAGYAKGDADAQHQVSGMVMALQERLNEAAKTMDGSRLNQLAIQTAVDAAREKRDPLLARTILDRLTTNTGAPLAKINEARVALDLLPRQIMELQVRDEQTKLAKIEAEKNLQVHTLWAVAGERMKEQGITDPWKVKWSFADMKDKMPEAWDELQRSMATSASQSSQKLEAESEIALEADPKKRSLIEKTFSPNGIDPSDQNDLITHFFMGGPAERKFASEYDFTVRSHKMGSFMWGSTSPQTHIELINKLNDPDTKPAEFQQALKDLATGHRISEEDFKWAVSQVAARGSGGPNGMGESNAMQLRNVRDQIRAAFIDPSNPKGVPEKDVDRDENYTLSIMGAERDAESLLTTLRTNKDFKAMTPDQQRAKVAQLVDQVAVDHGGWTTKQLIESRRQGNPADQIGLSEDRRQQGPLAPAMPTVGNKAPEKEPASGAELLAKVDPAAKSLAGYQKTALANYFISPYAADVHFRWNSDEQYIQSINNVWREGPTGAHDPSSYSNPMKLAYYRLTAPDYAKMRPSPEVDDMAQHEVAEADVARQRLSLIAPAADAARRELDAKLNDPYQPVPGSTEWVNARVRVMQLANTVEEYSTLRKLVGFTPAEVKAKGSDGWKTMPMFVNPYEIKLHGEKVAESLGIKDAKDKSDFIAHQLHLTSLMRAQPMSD